MFGVTLHKRSLQQRLYQTDKSHSAVKDTQAAIVSNRSA